MVFFSYQTSPTPAPSTALFIIYELFIYLAVLSLVSSPQQTQTLKPPVFDELFIYEGGSKIPPATTSERAPNDAIMVLKMQEIPFPIQSSQPFQSTHC